MSEQTPTNVLSFPKTKMMNTLSATRSKEEFVKQLGEHKEKYIEMVLVRTMNQLYNRLATEGFNTDDDVFFNDFCFVVESLKSAMFRQCGLEHPIQKFVDENFEAAQKLNVEGKDIEEDDDEE